MLAPLLPVSTSSNSEPETFSNPVVVIDPCSVAWAAPCSARL
jgi:hypothetical protein